MKIGRIGYINCAPVYSAIDRGIVSLPTGAELVTGTPSELNDLLVAGELDLSVISAVEYARHAKELVLLPDLAISCDGPVRSVALFSRRTVGRSDGAAVGVVAHFRRAARAAVSRRMEDQTALRGCPCGSTGPRGARGAAARRRARHRRCGAAVGRSRDIRPPLRPRRGVEALDGAAVRVRRLGCATRRSQC